MKKLNLKSLVVAATLTTVAFTTTSQAEINFEQDVLVENPIKTLPAYVPGADGFVLPPENFNNMTAIQLGIGGGLDMGCDGINFDFGLQNAKNQFEKAWNAISDVGSISSTAVAMGLVYASPTLYSFLQDFNAQLDFQLEGFRMGCDTIRQMATGIREKEIAKAKEACMKDKGDLDLCNDGNTLQSYAKDWYEDSQLSIKEVIASAKAANKSGGSLPNDASSNTLLAAQVADEDLQSFALSVLPNQVVTDDGVKTETRKESIMTKINKKSPEFARKIDELVMMGQARYDSPKMDELNNTLGFAPMFPTDWKALENIRKNKPQNYATRVWMLARQQTLNHYIAMSSALKVHIAQMASLKQEEETEELIASMEKSLAIVEAEINYIQRINDQTAKTRDVMQYINSKDTL